tara:strand:+ start:442 stop:888 length:447 start_codon:yes stop_codon:yes gene_type:complete
MDPKVWGPKLWFVIHTIALNYPDNPSYDQKRIHEDFFNNLVFLIPCDKCRIHYRQHINNNPVVNHLKNSDTLFRYTIDLHNEVNKTLNKRLYSYDEAVKFYRIEYGDERANNSYFTKKTFLGILIAIIIGGLGYIAYKKYPRRLIYKK